MCVCGVKKDLFIYFLFFGGGGEEVGGKKNYLIFLHFDWNWIGVGRVLGGRGRGMSEIIFKK